MKVFTSRTQRVGEFGESLAVRWLGEHGYRIIDRNWSCPLGEIDILATKDDTLHCIEVKSVQTRLSTRPEVGYNPADNVTRGKLHKVIMTCMEYARKIGIHGCAAWQVDVLLVRFDSVSKQAHVQMLQSVVEE